MANPRRAEYHCRRMDPLTVSQLSDHLKELLEGDPVLADIWVEGEVSNCRPAAGGHWYWTLKDEGAQVNCIMWRSRAAAQPVLPDNGLALQCHGFVSIYAAQGRYQLYVDQCQPAGLGDLHLRFEALKAKLAAEGLFDQDRKRPLPRYPLRIGVVTSPDAAALRDVCHVLARRWPAALVMVAPTLVQGDGAPPRIVAAIEAIAKAEVDVVIVCRGGGSIEDLWAFNDEAVARAICGCPIPVICGVGHETDFTIADFVADHRAPTPTAAAEMATPDGPEILQGVLDRRERLTWLVVGCLETLRREVDWSTGRLGRVSPAQIVHDRQLQLADLRRAAGRAIHGQLQLTRSHLTGHTQRLAALNPSAILARGYAHVTRSADGATVRRKADAGPGTGLTIQVADGRIQAVVAGQTSLFPTE